MYRLRVFLRSTDTLLARLYDGRAAGGALAGAVVIFRLAAAAPTVRDHFAVLHLLRHHYPATIGSSARNRAHIGPISRTPVRVTRRGYLGAGRMPKLDLSLRVVTEVYTRVFAGPLFAGPCSCKPLTPCCGSRGRHPMTIFCRLLLERRVELPVGRPREGRYSA